MMYSEEMLRLVQPTSVLPVTRNMPYYSASVPSRNQPRNMTGIYLGLEGNINPPKIRGGTGSRVRKGTSAKMRTPSEDRRHKIVESLREKEEVFRGFKGNGLKQKKPATPVNAYGDENLPPKCSHPQQLRHRRWGPAKSADPKHFNDVIKQNPRNYTAIINNGVTRSENLTGMMSFMEQYGWNMADVPLTDAIVEEVQRMVNQHDDLAGLEECFKKVCKSNPDSVLSLLPLRKSSARPGSFSTGFTVRSYRNPQNAEILADFENAHPPCRPKTVPANVPSHQRQPFVPAPYFFKHFNKTPGTAPSTKKRNTPNSQFEGEPSSALGHHEPMFGVGPLGGSSSALSRSLRTGRTTAWSEGDTMRIRRGTPRNDSPIKEIERQYNAPSPRHENSLSSTGPLEIRAEGFQLGTAEDRKQLNERLANVEATASRPSTTLTTPLATDNMEADRTIRLDLETEDGKKQEIYLDDKELTDNVVEKEKSKESEARVASMQEGAKERRRALEQILTEHDEIVKTIVRQSSGTFQTSSDSTRHQ